MKSKHLNVQKAARFAIVLNLLQIAVMLVAIGFVLSAGNVQDRQTELGVLVAGLTVVSFGAILDIREARNAEHIAQQALMLEETLEKLEALNDTLRRQRHDFSNHLQVVFSLLELEDGDEAMRYIENVYTDIKRTGSVLKTSIPAVNALLAAKRSDCEERSIRFLTQIQSDWKDMPIPGWELCRVLGNLIDNARDALSTGETQEATLQIVIDETPRDFIFTVTNNGPAIPPRQLSDIFRMGFTTKREGRGAGLSIVREILKAHGGTITVASDSSATRFSGSVPRTSEHIIE